MPLITGILLGRRWQRVCNSARLHAFWALAPILYAIHNMQQSDNPTLTEKLAPPFSHLFVARRDGIV